MTRPRSSSSRSNWLKDRSGLPADIRYTNCPSWARSNLYVIGRTPLVERRVESRGLSGRLLVTLEYFSPGGSKKDRIALEIIRKPRIGRAPGRPSSS